MRFALLAAALSGLAMTAHAAPDEIPAALAIGDVMPAGVSFTDQLGKAHTFAEFRGKPVVMEWTNPGCPFVHKFYDSGAMQKQQAAAGAKGVAWLTVNSSAKGKEGYMDAATATSEVAKIGFKGNAYVLDADGRLGRMLGAETTPAMFVLDKDGKLVYGGAVDSIPSFSKEDIPRAENYVNEALDAVLSGQPVTTAQTRAYGCSVKY
jgi:hypothetical protein